MFDEAVLHLPIGCLSRNNAICKVKDWIVNSFIRVIFLHVLALFPDGLLGHFSTTFLSGFGGHRCTSLLAILWCPTRLVSASGGSLPNHRLSADPTRFVGVRLLSLGGSRRVSILGSPQDGSDPTIETTSRTRALFFYEASASPQTHQQRHLKQTVRGTRRWNEGATGGRPKGASSAWCGRLQVGTQGL